MATKGNGNGGNGLTRHQFERELAKQLALKGVVVFAVDGIPVQVALGTDANELYEQFVDNPNIRRQYKLRAESQRVHVSCSFHLLKQDADETAPPLLMSFGTGIVMWHIEAGPAPRPVANEDQDKVLKQAETAAKAEAKKAAPKKAAAKKTTRKPAAKKPAASKRKVATPQKRTATKAKRSPARARKPVSRGRKTTRR